MTYELELLLQQEKDHGKIIVGVDFDDTIFPLSSNKYIVDRVNNVLKELERLQKSERGILCLWTVANEWSMVYKKYISESLGINFDYFNESPLFIGEDLRKAQFNLLLDDKAGLNETLNTLKQFNDYKIK